MSIVPQPQQRIRAAWMRGGTSKGLFFRRDDLPSDPVVRDRILLRAIGSPDPYGRQMDGVGGATSSTSKIVIMGPSQAPECDVDYFFGHVAISESVIDYSGSCGNLVAGAAVFALEEKLYTIPPEFAKGRHMVPVNIWQVNTKKRIITLVDCFDGMPVTTGDYFIDGVSHPSTRIDIRFLDPGGATTGRLLPTGNVVDTLQLADGKLIETTLIDAGNPTAFIRAGDVGLKGTEVAAQVDNQPNVVALLQQIRTLAAVKMGLADSIAAAEKQPAVPKVSFVSAPQPYTTTDGRNIAGDTIDIVARIVSMGKVHHAFTGTGGVALASAANISGTIVAQQMAGRKPDQPFINIGHPAGFMEVGSKVVTSGNTFTVEWVSMPRSARRLMEGNVLVPVEI